MVKVTAAQCCGENLVMCSTKRDLVHGLFLFNVSFLPSDSDFRHETGLTNFSWKNFNFQAIFSFAQMNSAWRFTHGGDVND